MLLIGALPQIGSRVGPHYNSIYLLARRGKKISRETEHCGCFSANKLTPAQLFHQSGLMLLPSILLIVFFLFILMIFKEQTRVLQRV